jgi:hypothetical protein
MLVIRITHEGETIMEKFIRILTTKGEPIMAKFIRILAIIWAMFSLFCSFFVGSQVPYVMGWLITLLSLLGSAITCTMLFSISMVLDHLDAIRADTQHIASSLQNLEKRTVAMEQAVPREQEAQAARSTQATSGEMDIIACPSCGRRQTAANEKCWSCGTSLR